ncbi:MAG TPA: hypothetical protein VIR81_06430, partial [Myxococcales bacterium]
AAASRIYAREVALQAVNGGLRWLADSAGAELATALRLPEIARAQAGLIGDMNAVADALYGRKAIQKAA